MTREAVAPRSTDAGRDADHEIALLLAFLNTINVAAETDVLDDPASWQHWCEQRGLPTATNTEAARDLRTQLRAAVTHTERPEIPGNHHWSTRVVLRDGVPTLTAQEALSSILNSAVYLVHVGAWPRIKICPADDCLEAFYDRSRNRSRTWCSMSVCGNREKARSWRERHVSP